MKNIKDVVINELSNTANLNRSKKITLTENSIISELDFDSLEVFEYTLGIEVELEVIVNNVDVKEAVTIKDLIIVFSNAVEIDDYLFS